MASVTPVNQLPEEPDAGRRARMEWWRAARLGMFVTFGPYAALGRGEWAMQQENIAVAEYSGYADQLAVPHGAVERWVLLAAQAGCRYVVLTVKHCDGYCLFDSPVTEFNSVKRGPRRDLVKEYVAACRAMGIRVGIYYCLMDWRHPDGDRCAVDVTARERFVTWTHANVLHLMRNYGAIDVLWFDGPWPLVSPELWRARELVAEVRRLQPDIIINNRARLAEDFSTPEGAVAPAGVGRAWEACMTLNGDWGYADTPDGDYRSVRDMLRMLRPACAHGGNLLLNVGPTATGAVPEQAASRLKAVGAWLKTHGEAVYGDLARVDGIIEPHTNTGYWTLRHNADNTWTGYYWLLRGDTHGSFSIARISPAPSRVTLMHAGEAVRFTDHGHRLRIEHAPALASEPVAGVPVLKFDFPSRPSQQIGAGMMDLPEGVAGWW
jgi:alpha-L-fucosidase